LTWKKSSDTWYQSLRLSLRWAKSGATSRKMSLSMKRRKPREESKSTSGPDPETQAVSAFSSIWAEEMSV